MKRMTENAIGYYTVKPEDIKNLTAVPESGGMYTYTPSAEFIEVLHDFKAVLLLDWMKVAEPISHKIGAGFSVLYPVGKPFAGGAENLGYAYFGGQMTKMVNPTFFELNGNYYIQWESIAI